jgi:hypothetical protein
VIAVDAGRFVLKDVDQDRISRRRHRELEPDRRSVPAKRGRELGWMEIDAVLIYPSVVRTRVVRRRR